MSSADKVQKNTPWRSNPSGQVQEEAGTGMTRNAIDFAKVVHAPLTEKELIALHTCKELGVDPSAASVLGKRMLPGRSPSDIATMLEMRTYDYLSPKLIVRRPVVVHTFPVPWARKNSTVPRISSTRLEHIQKRQVDHQINRTVLECGSYSRGFVCSEASGPIVSMAFNATSSLSGISCLVGSCAQQDAAYNRPGELLSLAFDQQAVSCAVLDGHSITSRGGVRLCSTVTAIVYSRKWNMFGSAGYDSRIALWGPEASGLTRLVSSPQVSGGTQVLPVHSLAISEHTPNIAFSLNGQVTLAQFSHDGTSDARLRLEPPLTVTKKGNRAWSNTVDKLCFDPTSPDRIVGLIGFADDGVNAMGGRLFQLDSEKRGARTLYQNAQHGITFFDHHPQDPLVVIGSGGVIDDAVGSGFFSFLDLRSAPCQVQHTYTGQMEVDTILFSNCGDFVAVTDTLDNSVTIWDTRNRQRALLSYSHSLPDQGESMMGFQWLHNGRIVSGGMDGKLKFYHLSQPHAPIQECLIGHQITCVGASVDDAMIFAGTEFGTIHSFSLNSSIASTYINKYQRSY